jgi:hypothetical protein
MCDHSPCRVINPDDSDAVPAFIIIPAQREGYPYLNKPTSEFGIDREEAHMQAALPQPIRSRPLLGPAEGHFASKLLKRHFNSHAGKSRRDARRDAFNMLLDCAFVR